MKRILLLFSAFRHLPNEGMYEDEDECIDNCECGISDVVTVRIKCNKTHYKGYKPCKTLGLLCAAVVSSPLLLPMRHPMVLNLKTMLKKVKDWDGYWIPIKCMLCRFVKCKHDSCAYDDECIVYFNSVLMITKI